MGAYIHNWAHKPSFPSSDKGAFIIYHLGVCGGFAVEISTFLFEVEVQVYILGICSLSGIITIHRYRCCQIYEFML